MSETIENQNELNKIKHIDMGTRLSPPVFFQHRYLDGDVILMMTMIDHDHHIVIDHDHQTITGPRTPG